MRYIRPYGSSFSDGTSRKLIKSGKNADKVDIFDHLEQEPKLLIAQWISVIDKIIRKPSGSRKPTKQQFELREKLGKAAWHILQGKVKNYENAKAEWAWKLHPYGTSTEDDKKEYNIKGGWYETFVGRLDIHNDADKIAQKILGHIHVKALKKNNSFSDYSVLQQRAKSINNSILKAKPKKIDTELTDARFQKKYINAYFQPDIAKIIYDSVQTEMSCKALRHHIACKLKQHFQKLFPNCQTYEEARAHDCHLLNLHNTVKFTYRKLLKGQYQVKDWATYLPKCEKTLIGLICSQIDNRAVNHLVRMGKIQHYKAVFDYQEQDCFGSMAQAEIKRHEAMLRIFRENIYLANGTISGLEESAEKKRINDPIGGTSTDTTLNATGTKRLKLLFAESGYECFNNVDDTLILQNLKKGWTQIRHKVVHFSKISVLQETISKQPDNLQEHLSKLWMESKNTQQQRLKDSLIAAHLEKFLDESRLKKIWEIVQPPKNQAPMPRFNRVLLRAKNIKYSLQLIDPAKSNELQGSDSNSQWKLCRYVCLKTIYENNFRDWVHDNENKLQEWVQKATKRQDTEAKHINAKNDESKQNLIYARAHQLQYKAKNFHEFHQAMVRETATEMRVQNGYSSDALNAKKQAQYIDNLFCEVVAYAFAEYIQKNQLAHLTKDHYYKNDTFDSVLSKINHEISEDNAEQWQQYLYFLLHCSTPEAVGRLSHQLAKWRITGEKLGEQKDDLDFLIKLQETLRLYLDVHDVGYSGADDIALEKDFETFYNNKEDFKRIFSGNSLENDRLLPMRGLREIQRFNHITIFKKMIGDNKISTDMVRDYTESLKDIAAHQKTKTDLHQQWARKEEIDEEKFCIALTKVIHHRNLSAQVTLRNHVRAYRVILAILSRLADFAWLYERDLYFVTLALLAEEGISPEDMFSNGTSLEKFRDGRVLDCCVLEALKKSNNSAIYDRLEKIFHIENCKKIRNDLAHINMFHPCKKKDLSTYIDNTIKLMRYDRKLRNAVVKSITDLLNREGIIVEWTMNKFKLSNATFSSRPIKHLGGKKFENSNSKKGKNNQTGTKNPESYPIYENLHSTQYLDLIAAMFKNRKVVAQDDIVQMIKKIQFL